jgi:hypothetical protein
LENGDILEKKVKKYEKVKQTLTFRTHFPGELDHIQMLYSSPIQSNPSDHHLNTRIMKRGTITNVTIPLMS